MRRVLSLVILLVGAGCGPSIVDEGPAPAIDETYGGARPLAVDPEEAERRINDLPGEVQWEELVRYATEEGIQFRRQPGSPEQDVLLLTDGKSVQGVVETIGSDRLELSSSKGSRTTHAISGVRKARIGREASWKASKK